MNVNELTIGQAKELAALFGGQQSAPQANGLQFGIGKKVIIRTYAAGVWFGEITQKSGDEVVLSNARRMWQWFAKEGISLSSVAVHGINQNKSRIAEPVQYVWLLAIEILPTTQDATESIANAKNATQS